MSDPFTVKEFVEPANGKIHRVYSYKRKPCQRVVLNSRLCEQIAGYFLIEKDLRSVLIWLEEIDRRGAEHKAQNQSFRGTDRENYNLVKGLFVAALTFCGKCFSKCEGRPVKLERAQLDAHYRELHDDCIAYRHNFAAHSGAKRIEQVQVALVFPAKYSKQVPFKIFKELDQPDVFWPAAGESTMAELVEHAQSIAQRKIDILSEKIRQEDVLAKSSTHWPPK